MYHQICYKFNIVFHFTELSLRKWIFDTETEGSLLDDQASLHLLYLHARHDIHTGERLLGRSNHCKNILCKTQDKVLFYPNYQLCYRLVRKRMKSHYTCINTFTTGTPCTLLRVKFLNINFEQYSFREADFEF